ncbi:hypothetical protein B2G71_18800 [Novosphingobium sp. PC22D]|uniref:I78 family peptidase inhibitor n=1 Tax=Novosphingobium sp. PC22D TaxID=1962403 RepID=UPI000BF1262E|nr:I78 family peptidase inhibitor [Novosphingobium sp. PC22D]PEQ11089.1 hypothetical protein B2G71_18800 [Novosphingobium sp. PC22D]
MTFRSLLLSTTLVALSLSGCGQSADSDAEDDFASRIAGKPQLQIDKTPVPEAPMEPGTVTDPQSSSCGAPQVKGFIGQVDSPDIRAKITEAVGDKAPGGVRFVLPGEATTDDMRPDRLNVMIDTINIVRDLRCG